MTRPLGYNIVLLGFMGTGKTTVGRLLAERLGTTFVDLDESIVQAAGRSIPEIFSEEGEAGFRERERAVVVAAAQNSGQVISCGGGIVKSRENLDLLGENGRLVCLTASAETILSRVGTDTNRPLLAGADRLSRIRELLAERAPLYTQIDLQVDTDGLSPDEIADAVLRATDC